MRNALTTVLLSVTSLILAACGAFAGDVTLSDGGDIAAAVTAASDGDTIWLETGTYKVNGLVVDKGVTIAALDGETATLDLQSKSGGVELNVAGAILKGCSLVNCRSYAVKVQADGAKMLDCICTGLNEKSGTGVETFCLSAGEIRGCAFNDFTGGYAYYNYIVRVTGGTFADSVIDNAKSQFDWMVYVNGTSAVVSNLVIRNSPGKGTGGGDNIHNGVLYLGAGLVTHSVITNSGSVGAAWSGTVQVDGGTLRNTLVADCKSPNYPGIYMTKGRMENCTIANNTAPAGSVVAYSLKMTGGMAVNNILSDSAASAKSVVVSGSTFSTNLVPYAVDCGVGNLVGKPAFVAPEKGDYAPGCSSPAVDAADRLDWMTAGAVDVAGMSRIKGSGPDIGAYEGPYGESDPLVCDASVENNLFRSDSADNTVRFKAFAGGAGASTATYAWYLDGSSTAASTDKDFECNTFAPGLHTVKLVVTPADPDAKPVEVTMTDCVLIYPKTLYVDSACTDPESPFASWDKAATAIDDVLRFLTTQNAYMVPFGDREEDAATIEVRNGTYTLNNLELTIPVRLVAASDAKPVIDIGAVIPGISFSHAFNVLDGFEIIRANKYAIRLYKGAQMRNCTITDAYNSGSGSSDTTVFCSPGIVSNCLFSGATSGYAYYNCLIKLEGASLVTGCTIEKMNNLDFTLYVTGEESVVSNCVLRDCPMDSCGGNLRYNMIDITSGLVTHCIITNCGNTSCTGDGDKKLGAIACVRGSKATLRNCLLVDNKAKEKAGIFISDGKVENCTVVGGTLNSTAVVGKRNLYQTGGTVVNSIFWNDLEMDGVTVSGGSFTYSSPIDLKTGEGNKMGDPLLDSAFVPKATSPVRDAGAALDWTTTDAIDLRGSNRVVNLVVDIGAMEGDELPDDLTLSLSSSFVRLDGDKVVYSVTPVAKIGATAVENPSFTWTVDGEAAGTSTGVKEFSLVPRATAYAIGCTITAQGQTTSETNAFVVHNGEFYVDANVPEENSAYPYSTPATAAKTLKEVLDIAHPAVDTRIYRVHITSGNYSTEGANLTTATMLLGEGSVVFNAGGNMSIGHDLAGVSNCVFHGCCLTMNRGAMRDVVVRNYYDAEPVVITGGFCDGLVVSNCANYAWLHKLGVVASGGRISNFRFDNIGGYKNCFEVSGSAVVSNGVLNNVGKTSFIGWGIQNNIHQHAFYQSGGSVSHVVITNCGAHDTSSEGLVWLNGGRLRNCLIANNRSTDCAGLYLSGGNAENCTVVVTNGASLHMTGHLQDGSTLVMTGGFATNCVFYSKETVVDGKYYCRVDGGKIGNCWLSVKGADKEPVGSKVLTGDDPMFARDSFVPAGMSPLNGAGKNQPWMTGAKDLAGEDRIRGRRVDIGAFEGIPRGLLLLVR